MKSKSKSRRAFLLTAGAGTAGAAVAIVAGRDPAAVVPGATAAAPGADDGYRVTEHIQKYYKTTEV